MSTSNMDEHTQIFLDKIGRIDGITTKKMFGGVGIFIDGNMFGMITRKGEYALKTSKDTCHYYESKGAERFHNMPYHLIPDNIWKSSTEMATWVEEAITIALS